MIRFGFMSLIYNVRLWQIILIIGIIMIIVYAFILAWNDEKLKFERSYGIFSFLDKFIPLISTIAIGVLLFVWFGGHSSAPIIRTGADGNQYVTYVNGVLETKGGNRSILVFFISVFVYIGLIFASGGIENIFKKIIRLFKN